MMDKKSSQQNQNIFHFSFTHTSTWSIVIKIETCLGRCLNGLTTLEKCTEAINILSIN